MGTATPAVAAAMSMISRVSRYRRGSIDEMFTYSALFECEPKFLRPNPSSTGASVSSARPSVVSDGQRRVRASCQLFVMTAAMVEPGAKEGLAAHRHMWFQRGQDSAWSGALRCATASPRPVGLDYTP